MPMTEPRQFLIYQSEDGRTRIDVMLDAETLWLKQKRLPELFSKVKGTISEHVVHVFKGEVLKLRAAVRLFRTVQIGDRRTGRDVIGAAHTLGIANIG